MSYELTANDRALIEAARKVLKRCYRDVRHTVGAAVRCSSGRVYAGVNVAACGYGPCAEAVAIGMAVSNAETQIEAIVAVHKGGVISPCGNCRQMILDYAPDATVIYSDNGEVRKTAARNLLPGAYYCDFNETEG
jgi:cytidine deaminase